MAPKRRCQAFTRDETTPLNGKYIRVAMSVNPLKCEKMRFDDTYKAPSGG